MIELNRTTNVLSIPKMCCRGSVSITNKGTIVLSIMHDTISINQCFKGIFLRGIRYIDPIYIHCISDDGVECLMVVGKLLNGNYAKRVIIPFW